MVHERNDGGVESEGKRPPVFVGHLLELVAHSTPYFSEKAVVLASPSEAPCRLHDEDGHDHSLTGCELVDSPPHYPWDFVVVTHCQDDSGDGGVDGHNWYTLSAFGWWLVGYSSSEQLEYT